MSKFKRTIRDERPDDGFNAYTLIRAMATFEPDCPVFVRLPDGSELRATAVDGRSPDDADGYLGPGGDAVLILGSRPRAAFVGHPMAAGMIDLDGLDGEVA